jgi:predicted DNA-binding WGR domain protein
MRYFELINNKSAKFWEINDYWNEDRKFVHVRYGKIGTEGRTIRHYYHGPAKNGVGTKMVDKLVAQKLKKGYVERKFRVRKVVFKKKTKKRSKIKKNQKGGALTIKNKNISKSKKKTQKNVVKILVFVYNINYYDKDGDKIIEKISEFRKKNKDYVSDDGQSGSYGLYKRYLVPKEKTIKFKKDITSFYNNLNIKNLKISFAKEGNIDSYLYLLDKEPIIKVKRKTLKKK